MQPAYTSGQAVSVSPAPAASASTGEVTPIQTAIQTVRDLTADSTPVYSAPDPRAEAVQTQVVQTQALQTQALQTQATVSSPLVPASLPSTSAFTPSAAPASTSYSSSIGTGWQITPVIEDLTVHSQRNCLPIAPEAMARLQNEVVVSRYLQPGVYTITLKSGTFDYQIQSGHQGEPFVLLWIYGGKVINRRTGIEVGATWSSLNGYGDTLTLEVREATTLCGFYFDTYLEDNEGAVVISLQGPSSNEDLVVDSRRNCYFIDPETMGRLEQEVSVSRLLPPGSYAITLKSGAYSYRSESGRSGEAVIMLWIYGGVVVNRKTGVEVGATWSSLNGYGSTLRLDVRQPATVCAFFFDSNLEDNQGEIVLSIERLANLF